ncbi:CHAT domain-containing protein [candidate division KSB1 bacterium]|nr:CHAT domain-containing protein [candidate division KSB1 bacterium]
MKPSDLWPRRFYGISLWVLLAIIVFFTWPRWSTAGTVQGSAGNLVTTTGELNQWMHEAIAAYNAGRYNQAETRFLNALRLAQQSGAEHYVGPLFYYLGQNYQAQKRFEKAQKAYAFALRYLTDKSQHCDVLIRLGDLHFLTRGFTQSRKYYQQALESCPQMADSSQQIHLLLKIGDCYFQSGDLLQAYFKYYQTLKFVQTSPTHLFEAKCLNAIGYFYYYFGEYDQALQFYRLALHSIDPLKSADLEAQIHRNLGQLSRAADDSSSAKYHFLKALQIYQQTQQHAGEIQILVHLGDLFREFGAYNRALKIYAMAHSLREQFQVASEAEILALGIAECELALGNLKKSLNAFNHARRLAIANQQQAILWQIHAGTAQVYEKQRKYARALTEYEQGIRLLDSLRAKIEIRNLWNDFFEDTTPLYENYIKLLLNSTPANPQQIRKAFEMLERFRAQAFFESLNATRIPTSMTSDFLDSLLSRQGLLEQDLTQNLFESQQPELANRPATDSLVLKHLFERTEIETQLRTVELQIHQELQKQNPRLDRLNWVLSLNTIQDQLAYTNQLVLAYFLSEPYSYIWVIGYKEFAVYQIASRTTINEQIRLLLGNMTYPEPRKVELVNRASQRLYEILIRPIETRIQPKHTLIIIPDLELAYLPFELLPRPPMTAMQATASTAPESTRTRYLIEQNRILYAPSVSLFLNKNLPGYRAHQTWKKLLALGDPAFEPKPKTNASNVRPDAPKHSQTLPTFWPTTMLSPLKYSRQEIQAISQVFDANLVKTLTGEAATETHFKQLQDLDKYKRIHFATHGLINETYPELTGLVLGPPDSLNDGILRIPEIYQLHLDAELVVLSGCQTGRGRLTRLNGVENLARAFFFAGTSAVIVSLWNVDDRSTTEFMSNFYQHLKTEDLPIAMILAMTKNDFLNLPEYQQFREPYYWAPFILISIHE